MNKLILDLLNDVIEKDEKGIERCWGSDHCMPWWYMESSGGAAWPWI
jgi:coenzyme F420-dependent glucose-6-phosphate dehydrogenase